MNNDECQYTHNVSLYPGHVACGMWHVACSIRTPSAPCLINASPSVVLAFFVAGSSLIIKSKCLIIILARSFKMTEERNLQHGA